MRRAVTGFQSCDYRSELGQTAPARSGHGTANYGIDVIIRAIAAVIHHILTKSRSAAFQKTQLTQHAGVIGDRDGAAHELRNRSLIVQFLLVEAGGRSISMNSRTIAAPIHEAGHAVVARVLKIPAGEVQIGFDSATNTYGSARSADPDLCQEIWKRTGYRSPLSPRDAVCVTVMSGCAAEAVLLGKLCNGHGCDQRTLDRLGITDREIAQLWRTACRLVRQNSDAVERVADALAERGSLSGREIDRLLGMALPPR